MDVALIPLLQLRRDLLACYRAGLEAVAGRGRVRAVLSARPTAANVHLIAIGKAASAMSLGALDAWNHSIVRGLVISKDGHIDSRLLRDRRFDCIESRHPLPDQRSLQAGRALLDFLRSSGDDAHFLFLVSGGASSLVEVPAGGVSLDDVVRANRWLLGSGLDIAAMNVVRQGLSAIKGGRLATHLCGRAGLALLISDVEGDRPEIIGSGLLTPNHGRGWADLSLPPWLQALLQNGTSLPVADTRVEVEVIATLARAKAAAAARAAELGYRVELSNTFQRDDACQVGWRLGQSLWQGQPGLYVWGGETTVQLPPTPGRGGRCQTLALCAAQSLAGSANLALLAAGTDGSDGPGEDAGALIDGETVVRGVDGGYDPEQCLARADAGSFLEAAGDLVQTGPTGTNVMDLILGAKLA